MNSLDLEPIIVKVMDSEEGLGWDINYAIRVSEEYKKFLFLCKKYPDLPIVPSSHVDDFWHYHILDTLKYKEDCDNFFGYFLHHFPYFGMRGEEDARMLQQSWDNSLKLYESVFGSAPKDLWVTSKRCPNCGRRYNSISTNLDRPKLSAIINV